MDYFETLNSDSDLKKAVSDVVDMTIDIHSSNANLHNILHSLAVTEKDINEDFINLEDHITSKASEKLSELGVKTDNIKEKVHISMNLIQSFAHENTYDKHKYLNYNAMKNEVENIIISLFS